MGAAPMCTPLRPRGCTPHTRRRDRLQPCIPPRHTRCTQSRRSAHSPGPPCLPQSPALAALMLGQHAWAAGREQAAQPAASSLPRLALHPGSRRHIAPAAAPAAVPIAALSPRAQPRSLPPRCTSACVANRCVHTTASSERPQTKSGGSSVRRRTCGRLLSTKLALLFARPPAQKSSAP